MRSPEELGQLWLEGVEWEAAPDTRPHPFVLYLPYEDAEFGRGLRLAGRITAQDLAPLLPNDGLTLEDLEPLDPDGGSVSGEPTAGYRRIEDRLAHRESVARQIVAQIGRWDWAIDDSADEAAASWKQQEAEELACELETLLRRNLSGWLANHLRKNAGTPLKPPLSAVWLQLVARGIWTPGVQVCDRCAVVFASSHKDARRCPSCQKNRPPTVYPARDGGRHISIRPLPDGSYEYVTECIRCKNRFRTEHAAAKRCPSCKPSTIRSQDSRARVKAEKGTPTRLDSGGVGSTPE